MYEKLSVSPRRRSKGKSASGRSTSTQGWAKSIGNVIAAAHRRDAHRRGAFPRGTTSGISRAGKIVYRMKTPQTMQRSARRSAGRNVQAAVQVAADKAPLRITT